MPAGRGRGVHAQRAVVAVRFFRAVRGEGGRFGLGLSIVSRVVKANKYHVKGYNTDDGVCFRIYREQPKQKKKQNEKKTRRDLKKDHAETKKELFVSHESKDHLE